MPRKLSVFFLLDCGLPSGRWGTDFFTRVIKGIFVGIRIGSNNFRKVGRLFCKRIETLSFKLRGYPEIT